MFLFQSVSVPLIVLLLLIAGAVPVYSKLYMKFHRKYITTGKLQKTLDEVKDVTEKKFEVVKEVTEKQFDNVKDVTHRVTENITEATQKTRSAYKKKQESRVESHVLEKKVLQVLAEKKESGMLDRSIADELSISPTQAKRLFDYLEGKDFIESVNGPTGMKYYLTELGKKYCEKKGYLA